MDSKATKVLLVEDNPVDVLAIRDELSSLNGASFLMFEVESLGGKVRGA